MDLYFTTLRKEVTYRIKHQIELLMSEGKLELERKNEIEKFVKSRFGEDMDHDIIENRINEMIESFPEFYTLLTEIQISKYR